MGRPTTRLLNPLLCMRAGVIIIIIIIISLSHTNNKPIHAWYLGGCKGGAWHRAYCKQGVEYHMGWEDVEHLHHSDTVALCGLREGEGGEREREREREREIDQSTVVCWLVSLSVDWEVRKSSLDLSHLWVFSKVFFSGRTFTQGLKIIGEKHAGNLSW